MAPSFQLGEQVWDLCLCLLMSVWLLFWVDPVMGCLLGSEIGEISLRKWTLLSSLDVSAKCSSSSANYPLYAFLTTKVPFHFL